MANSVVKKAQDQAIPIVLGGIGVLLLYAAIKGKDPVGLVKQMLGGPPAGGLDVRGVGNLKTGDIGAGVDHPVETWPDGTAKQYPNGSARKQGDPTPDQLPAGDPRKVLKLAPGPLSSQQSSNVDPSGGVTQI